MGSYIPSTREFSTPHGDGGPGSGPVACKDFLAQFLPGLRIGKQTDGTFTEETAAHTIGNVRSFSSNFLVVVRAFCYILTLGREGIPEASTTAVLNANYMMHKLSGHYKMTYDHTCMHEFVMTLEQEKHARNVSALDIAKALLDHGIHPPTMYFPLIVHEALMIEPTEIQITSDTADPVTIKTRQILLASGSVPSIPPIPGHDLPGIMTSDELLSWDKEPFSSLLIIGRGVIGVEFAGIWQTPGTKVTILEALPSLIANMDKELGQSLKLSLKKKGADIHTGAKVQSLESTEDGILCTYTEKDTVCTCTAQAVLIATGRKPYTVGLFSDGLAPSMERGRILTDEHFQTSIPGIYAIGDVNGKLQLAHAATAQGLHAVHHIAARSTSDTDSCSVSWSVDPPSSFLQ